MSLTQEQITSKLGCAPHPKCPHLKDAYGLWIVCDENGEDYEHYNTYCMYCNTGKESDGVDYSKFTITDILNYNIPKEKVLSYIARIKNSGMGKEKSLEYLQKYVENYGKGDDNGY